MKRLLLIEEDDLTYRLILNYLKKIDYHERRVIRCRLLADLEKINSKGIEIVLTNLTLPDSAFPDTFEKVSRKFPHTPIIILTHASEIENAKRATQLGADDYLVKDNLEKEILKKPIQYAIRQKEVLDKISVEKQNLSSIINNTRDIIWSIDKSYKIISANDAFWGRMSTITGKNTSEIHRGDFDHKLFSTWSNYFERAFKGETYKIIWNETHFGFEIYEEVSFNPIYGKTGGVTGICCFSRDITEQRTYLNKIEKQNKLLKQIAWEQSHKVRRPVANILALTQLINYENPTEPNNARILSYLRESAELLDEAINTIVTFSTSS